ncbi:hypothetical protein N7528_003693 [Penicillium herquei]|nr:hypothetical protein N7528_003693 [Penicillium herquei]
MSDVCEPVRNWVSSRMDSRDLRNFKIAQPEEWDALWIEVDTISTNNVDSVNMRVKLRDAIKAHARIRRALARDSCFSWNEIQRALNATPYQVLIEEFNARCATALETIVISWDHYSLKHLKILFSQTTSIEIVSNPDPN